MSIYNLISLVGIFVLMFLAWGVSKNRRKVNWRLIFWGVVFQLAFASFVFLVPGGRQGLWVASQTITKLIESGSVGSEFVFGKLATGAGDKSIGFILAFQALPVIIFFSALMAVLYYLQIMPIIVRAFAWFFARAMRVSGAESLYTASQIFGGVEVATTIRPYLTRMTNSELHCLMTAGLATVAVNVLVIYIMFMGGVFNDIAGHLVCASILGAPAALISAKLVWPEDGVPETLGHIPPIVYKPGDGLTDSVINGAMDGVKLIVGIVALLIAFLGLLALVNLILGAIVGMNLQQMLGYVFWPLSLIMGVPPEDARKVGELLGLRAIATEIPSYQQLAELIRQGNIQERSALIAVYSLCGFAHVASVAIYVGGTAALIPQRRSDLAKVAWRALIAGTIASLMIGAVAGTVYTHQPIFLKAVP
jgi:concentrative nucleoside transporter, CNT family